MFSLNIGGFGLFIIVLWAGLGLLNLYLSRDLFSPTKFYMVQLPIFFGGVIDGNWNIYTYIVCIVLVVSSVAQMTLESRAVVPHAKADGRFKSIHDRISFPVRNISIPRVHLIVWLLSAIPLLVQFVVVYSAGGLTSFIGNLGGRVAWMSGMGPILILLRWLPIINMCYVSILFCKRGISYWSVIFGILHTLLCVGNGLLVGSRSSSMFPLLFAVLACHYCRKRFSTFLLFALCISFIVLSAYLGAVRETIKVDQSEIILAKKEGASDYRWSNFIYGLMGVDTVSEAQVENLQYGLTYITALTNFIPRNIWPGKPDTGGVIFTKEYLGDMWGGASYATPGLFGEAMINFGLDSGLVIGVFLLLLGFKFNSVLYNYVVRMNGWDKTSNLWYFVVLYTAGIQYTNSLLVGEFANCTVGFIINVIFIWVSVRCLAIAVVNK
jgi:hypothetical protein